MRQGHVKWKALKVRVVEGRHLSRLGRGVDGGEERVPDVFHRKRTANDGSPLNAGVYVVLSFNNKHRTTELCHNLTRPSWQRIASFPLGGDQETSPEPGKGTHTEDQQHSETFPDQPTQSLNPFAPNFAPPPVDHVPEPGRPALAVHGTAGSKPLPAAAPAPSPPAPPQDKLAATPAATTAPDPLQWVLHVRILSDSLVSKDLLGDVALDLGTFLESRGAFLATDRIGYTRCDSEASSGPTPADYQPPAAGTMDVETSPACLAADTWVALRQGAGELRVQILMGEEGTGTFSDNDGDEEDDAFPVKAEGLGAPDMGASGAGGSEPAPWPALDELVRTGQVHVSVPPGQDPLDNNLRAIQEQYTLGLGWGPGSPDGASTSNGQAAPRTDSREGSQDSLAWDSLPPQAQAKLRRIVQYSVWREKRQFSAWARLLAASPELYQALSNPPAFGALQEGHGAMGGRDGVRVGAGAASSQQVETSLSQLVTGGIPRSILHDKTGAAAGAQTHAETGASVFDEGAGAFEGGEKRDMGLGGVSTTIPGVEVVRVSGHLCCAEYRLQVTCASSGESWMVLRRYSDFRELYDRLPPSFTAIMPPLPPKSWRSLSHLTMTPEFLEERRVALEVVLRRLAINAVGADGVVQGKVMSFLGLSMHGGAGHEAGMEAEVAGYLAALPPHVELSLPVDGPGPVSLVGELRVTLWMLLSGAANKVHGTERRLQYASLARVIGKEDWLTQGGSIEDYLQAAAYFPTIDVDVNRTNVKHSDEREQVRTVLKSFALRNPGIGYCQVMNFVALFLLRAAGGRADLCYWLLDALATAVVPRYWEGLSEMRQAREDLAILRVLVGERMPQLLLHLDDNGLPLEVLLCDWMLSLFCRVLPPAAVLRVWDWLFLDGADVLLYVVLAVLRLAEDAVRSVEGASATADTLAAVAASIHDADSLIELAVSERECGLDRNALKELREGAGAGVHHHADFDAAYDVADKPDIIRAIEEVYEAERQRQQRMNLEDADARDNGPKEISIYCHQAPQVKIVDLAEAARRNNDCLVLHIDAPDLSSKLVLKCDGSVQSTDFMWGDEW